ncbi:hypothetical protein GH714_014993 [Hevea brasiliensis]|uniref:MATH domain-containing protein n=1 Tax=Hevea brasiliensis TaxID=3981 RepID=A0A6A6L4U3_HEVBR|nr:hypothetical protein GH714_014993 [Hevea brasiliensis]
MVESMKESNVHVGVKVVFLKGPSDKRRKVPKEKYGGWRIMLHHWQMPNVSLELREQKPKPTIKRGFMHVDLCINGKAIRALVDRRTIDNFMAEMMALQFKLDIEEDMGKIKAINTISMEHLGSESSSTLSNGPRKDCFLLMRDKSCVVLFVKETDVNSPIQGRRLSLYPKGNKKADDKNEHVSLYLVLSKSNALPLHREVNVYFKLFVYNQILDKYLVVQDAKEKIRRFRGAKTKWGFDKLVSLNAFNEASNGYLVDDCCILGAEIFVIERTGKEEKGKCLSMFLQLEDSKPFDSGQKLYTEFILRVRDQLLGVHHEQKGNNKYCTSAINWGFRRLILLSDLNDASKGFILDNTVIIEVQIPLMTVVKDFS